LHIHPTDFIGLAHLNEKSTYGFAIDSSERAYCLVLNMKELPDGNRRCIFALDLPNDVVRCGIHPLRPTACRAYPVAFVDGEVDVKPGALCPDGSWDISQLDSDKWQEELERHAMEFSIYAFLVANWNRAMMKQLKVEKPDFRPFFDFLVDVYGRLELARAAVPGEAWSGIWRQWRHCATDGLNPLCLKTSEIGTATSWGWWLRSIQKAVVEVCQDRRLYAIN
jgi:Fe-S-cluster containining protein